jgi:BirA family biotin operon repressor/biotin-[acetyl-CoA-carboxylase] ligase
VTVTTSFLARFERFDRVGSTNEVVREWLAAGEPEVCLAVAREQTAGRGRQGRTWVAPPGAGLLLSVGFRPTWLAPDHAWRLAAAVALAMAESAERTLSLADGSIGLKWPNDLVDGQTDDPDGPFRKLGGVLGETDGLGTDDPRVVVGIGLNTDWDPADFPTELASTMTSLRAMRADRPIDADALLDGFVERLAVRIGSLRDGAFDVRHWIDRQVTTGRSLDLVLPDGTVERVRGEGVDAETGALRVVDPGPERNERAVLVGEIRHVRLVGV